jgi:hypothetical protein
MQALCVFGKDIGQGYGLDLPGAIRSKSAFGFGSPEANQRNMVHGK